MHKPLVSHRRDADRHREPSAEQLNPGIDVGDVGQHPRPKE